MNLLKYQKFLESNQDQDINSICQRFKIKNYTINEDNSIDVDGDVNLPFFELNKIPLKFRKVTGHFDCSYNQLKSLEGCPESVGGYFHCQYNILKTLEGGPKSVGGNFNCSCNRLKTLKGGPEIVGGDEYHLNYNELSDLIGFPEFWEGSVYFRNNPIDNILYKFPYKKLCKAIYWINEYGVLHGGKINQDRLEEVFITLGLDYSSYRPILMSKANIWWRKS